MTEPLRHGAELYKCYNQNDVLLYVGESKTKIERIATHSKRNWWCEVAYVNVEHFLTKNDARIAEELTIKTEKPRYNVVHNRDNMVNEPNPLKADCKTSLSFNKLSG